VEDQPGDQEREHQIHVTDRGLDPADTLQPHDHLGPDLEAADRADDHDHAKFVVHVAELAVPHGRDQGFSGHVGDVRADGEGHGKPQDVQARCDHPGAAHAEKPADDAHTETENDQSRPEYLDPGDGHEYI
jgi:hypothetical protein